jgi:hypothetical protein
VSPWIPGDVGRRFWYPSGVVLCFGEGTIGASTTSRLPSSSALTTQLLTVDLGRLGSRQSPIACRAQPALYSALTLGIRAFISREFRYSTSAGGIGWLLAVLRVIRYSLASFVQGDKDATLFKF